MRAKSVAIFLGVFALGIFLGSAVDFIVALTAPSPDVSSSGASITLAGPPDITQTIRMENTLFDTQEITVSVGDNVLLILENVDPILHDFFVEDLDIFVENGRGLTTVVAFTADQPGTFPFICTVPGHREGGMEGIIRIQP